MGLQTPVATIVNSIDRQGNYHRKITLTMDITPDHFSDWEKIVIINPMYGTIDVKHIGRLAGSTVLKLRINDYIYVFGLKPTTLHFFDKDKSVFPDKSRSRLPVKYTPGCIQCRTNGKRF